MRETGSLWGGVKTLGGRFTTSVYCTTSFVGFHRWPEAPPQYSHLEHLHRHVFHVRVEMEVTADREIEIQDLKTAVDRHIRETQDGIRADPDDVQTWSCEMWARSIMDRFHASVVEVSEDGENGAVVRA